MRTFAILPAALALIATASHAQLATGYSGQPGVRPAAEIEYWEAIEELGACLFKDKKPTALAFLASTRGTEEEAAAQSILVGRNTGCLRNLKWVRLATVELRGAIAEAAYEKSTLSAPEVREFSIPTELARGEAVRLGADRLIAQMADCVAGRYPGQLHRLFLTRWGSKEQTEMMAGLAEQIGSCSPGGIRFSVAISELRSAFAEAAFRRTAPVAAAR